MSKYRVSETTEIKTTYYVEANSASAAINKVKNQKNNPNNEQSLEQHFIAREIEEENKNEQR